jgi:signal transduction histidine kinase
MTLRRKLTLRYTLVVGVCLGLLAALAHHEFIVEPRVRKQLGIPELPPQWGEYSEVTIYALMPAVLGCGWWLMRRTLRPIDELARRVQRVQVENLGEPLPRSHRGDEVDRLTVAFNLMAARVNESFQQIRRFTLHASHELKTPLTTLRLSLETVLRETRDLPPEQQRLLHTQLEELERMARIVDGLTLLTKADAGLVPLERRPLQLDELVRETCEDGQLLAEPRQVEVALTACDRATVLGDRHWLRHALFNLTDNAVKYNQAAGSVRVALRKAADAAEIEITNTGDGISPELQPRVFERFVRGESAQARAVEGCGLGLAIVEWVVQAHGGTVRVSSEPGKPTTAQVRLPLVRPA